MNAGSVDVAIVGAGFCGTMLAVHLAQERSIRTAIFERNEFARGVAYSTRNPRHLLNLTASKMSANPEEPSDFVDWLGDESPGAYVSRSRYAQYLQSIFERALSGAPQVERYREPVVSIEPASGGWQVNAERRCVRARCVVLAVGIFPPAHDFLDDVVRSSSRYVGDPWSVPFDDLFGHVLLIGSGLTAVDVLVELQHRRYPGDITVLSRHGLSAQTHEAYGDPVERHHDERTPRTMLRSVRRAIGDIERQGGNWRAVVDGLRASTPRIWGAWPLRERQRFLRHLLRYWEVSRRRVPPEAAGAVAALQNHGRLKRMRGRIRSIAASERGQLSVRIERCGRPESLEADWIVNCTGPQSDVAKVEDALVRSLLREGLIRPHPTRIGIDATTDGRVVGADGAARGNLFAVGSLLRGVLYESISVVELSVQVKALSQQIRSLPRISRGT